MNRVALGYCSGEQIDSMFARSLVSLLLHEHAAEDDIAGVIHVRSGPRVAAARNAIVSSFLRDKPEADWLLMLDTDMVFSVDLVQRMLESATTNDVKILGALCFGGGYTKTIFPTMYAIKGDTIIPMEDIPENQVVKVSGTGAACLLVHRSVYESMIGKFGEPHHWFTESVWNGKEVGEDLTFCLRAKLCGWDTHVDTSIQVGHARTKVIGLDDWNMALTTEEVQP